MDGWAGRAVKKKASVRRQVKVEEEDTTTTSACLEAQKHGAVGPREAPPEGHAAPQEDAVDLPAEAESSGAVGRRRTLLRRRLLLLHAFFVLPPAAKQDGGSGQVGSEAECVLRGRRPPHGPGALLHAGLLLGRDLDGGRDSVGDAEEDREPHEAVSGGEVTLVGTPSYS